MSSSSTPPEVVRLLDDQEGSEPTAAPAAVTRAAAEIELTDQTNLLPFRRLIAVFGGLSLCALVTCLDSTILATALPKITADFNAGAVSSWVPSAYMLTSTVFQPLCKLDDIHLDLAPYSSRNRWTVQ